MDEDPKTTRSLPVWFLQLGGLGALVYVVRLEAMTPGWSIPEGVWALLGFAIAGPEIATRWWPGKG